ncbi:MAG TPA: ABC transporter permease [Cyclobacteriaceae bacterium]
MAKPKAMLKYSLLLFLRNIRRQKLFSFINLLGLSVSIASTLLIYLYVQNEFSYDRFHHDADRIYRVNQTFIWGENNTNQFASTGPGVAYALKEELPEIELMSSIHTPGNFIVSYTNTANEVIAFEEDRVLAADSNFFTMFNFRLIKGDPKTVFSQDDNLVMTQSTAKKYFGDQDPIGKLVRLGGLNSKDQKTFEVTGVVEDIPDNSYIQFDIMLSLRGFHLERRSWSWVWTQLETYIKLDKLANIENVREKLKAIPQKHAAQTLKVAFGQTWDEYMKSGKKWELFLQPLTGIHLPAETVLNRLNDSGNISVIYSFIGAAIFIALLSCINFMNLSTAQFTKRVKEAGVRKILGLGKKQLSLSYFFEALIFCFAALLAALALTQLLLPQFNLITDKSLKLDLIQHPEIAGALFLLTLFMAVVSGSYPAIFLSGFNPIEAVKGKLKIGKEGRSFRNGLVVFQFAVSIMLIICTAIVFQQLNYVSDKDLGFRKENLLVLQHVEEAGNGENLANDVEQIPGITNATWCTSVPPAIYGGDTFVAEGASEVKFPLNYTQSDERFIPTLNINLKLGRNFSKDVPADSNRVIVNESALQKIGWPIDESVLGKTIAYPNSGNDNAKFEIVGVVSDFNYWSLANPIEPMAIFHINNKFVSYNNRKILAVRVETQSANALETTLATLKKTWKVHAGDAPFEYSFVDQAFAETFRSQQQFGKVLTVMATLAILIACLGLLGMIVYALEQRTKEIGIRKVSGASAWDILKLISKGYTKLIVVAFILGAPFSYWLMQQWLSDFAYRITPSFWIYIVTGVSTLLVAMLITSYHSMKAALTNPVDVLKDE